MPKDKLSGVIAAVATPIDEAGNPDLARAVKLARFLLDNGCDGLNVLGTTGEATSFSRYERKMVMDAYKAHDLPLRRLMVGTGAAAIADAVALTQHAAMLGFAGALGATAVLLQGRAGRRARRLYRHDREGDGGQSDPALSLSLPGDVRHSLACGAGATSARDAWRAHRRPEGFFRRHGLMHARRRRSPTTSRCSPRPKRRSSKRAAAPSPVAFRRPPIAMPICARAPGAKAIAAALEAAVAIRKLFDGKPLVAGVKALLAHIHGDRGVARVKPPLAPFSAADRAAVIAGYDAVTGQTGGLSAPFCGR